MLDTPDHFLCGKLHRFWPTILPAAAAHQLDPYLLGALVLQESKANPYALRVERGFWTRYGAAIWRRARSTITAADDHWLIYPDVAAASYGLCQILYPVALEYGLSPDYPTELCDPTLNVDLGALILAKHIRHHGGDLRRGLLRYNGGGDPDYPDAVLRWHRHLLASPTFGAPGTLATQPT